MSTIVQRFRALEPYAALYGLNIDYAEAQQNGKDCWFVATLSLLRNKGIERRLPADFSIFKWQSLTRKWMDTRGERLKFFAR